MEKPHFAVFSPLTYSIENPLQSYLPKRLSRNRLINRRKALDQASLAANDGDIRRPVQRVLPPCEASDRNLL